LKFQLNKLPGLEALPNGAVVIGRKESSPIPFKLDQGYSFSPDEVRTLVLWANIGSTEPFFIHGPTGSGKSSLVQQFAGRLNIPCMTVCGHARMELSDLVGYIAIQKDGSMSWIDGPLTISMRKGYWFLLDEIDLIDPGTLAGLNAVLQGQPLIIPENEGEVILPHPSFRFLATGNTAGNGDDTGRYQGTVAQNMAAMDRFWVMEKGYMAFDKEVEVLRGQTTKIPEPALRMLVNFAFEVREQFDQGNISVTLSTRSLCRVVQIASYTWQRAMAGHDVILEALEVSMIAKAPKDEQEALRSMKQRVFGEATETE